MTYLLADIGGTNARFALAEPGTLGRADCIRVVQKLKVADYDTPEQAVEAYLKASDCQPTAACIAVAGPVTGDAFTFTNSPWQFSAKAMAQRFGMKQVKVINDFQAQALGLPFIQSGALTQIGGPEPESESKDQANKIVLGPGTGLGFGGLIRSGNQWQAVTGEGGHVSFAPQDALDLELLRLYWQQHGGRISYERILAGFGLEQLYALMGQALNWDQDALPASEITRLALAAEPHAMDCAKRYLRHLGSYAGDMAMVFTSLGGVYLTGGVALALEPLLGLGDLRAGFEDKGRISHIPQQSPIYLIKTDETPFLGALYSLEESLA
mgnify:CR=1 FL=1